MKAILRGALAIGVGALIGIGAQWMAAPALRPKRMFQKESERALSEGTKLVTSYKTSLRLLSVSVESFAHGHAASLEELSPQAAPFGAAIVCHNRWFAQYEQRRLGLQVRLLGLKNQSTVHDLFWELEQIAEFNSYHLRPQLNAYILPLILSDQGALAPDEIARFDETRASRGRDLSSLIRSRLDLMSAYTETATSCPDVVE